MDHYVVHVLVNPWRQKSYARCDTNTAIWQHAATMALVVAGAVNVVILTSAVKRSTSPGMRPSPVVACCCSLNPVNEPYSHHVEPQG